MERGTESVRSLTQYAGLCLDQFGVLHDGTSPYPGVLDALAQLREGGVRLGILSNAPGRAETVAQKLVHMGFPPFDTVVCSGEMLHQYLRDPSSNPAPTAEDGTALAGAVGKKVLWVSYPLGDNNRKGYGDFFDGLDVTLVGTAAEADVLIVSGVGAVAAGTPREAPLDFERAGDLGPLASVLDEAAARKLPLLCATP